MSATAAVPPSITIVNPATGARLAEIPETEPEEVARAVERARAAQPGWARLPFRERAAALRRLARRLRDDDQLIESLVAESGQARYEAEAIELFYTLEATRYFTGRAGRRALADELRSPFVFAYKRTRVVRHPRGVVAVIGPWNFPLLNNFADCVAPLIAGNAVILKPSEWTPLTSLRVAALWRELGLPEGVFQVLPGRGPVGQALCERADMVFFTGSVGVGRQVARIAADRLIPCVLELGGKSAMIVLADADLPRAARAAVWSCFLHSGQVCVRTERVLVEEPVADRFVALVQAEMARLRQGTGDVDVGAITFPPQIERVERQIADALGKGARLVAGGARRSDLPGQFFEPTLLADATPEMSVMRDETFGPVMPVMRVRDAEQALAVANATETGLAGSVWSRDERRARALARRLETGSVCVNDVLFNYFSVEAPLGGVKASGLGVRHGPEGLRQFCRIESVLEDRPLLGWLAALVSGQLIFPYRARSLRLLRWLMRRIY